MNESITETMRLAFESQFESIHAKLDSLDQAIRGNGKLGLLVRVDRLERAARHQDKLIWMVIGAIVTCLAKTVSAWIGGMS